MARFNEPLTINQSTYDVVGANSGRVYAKASSISEALKAQNDLFTGVIKPLAEPAKEEPKTQQSTPESRQEPSRTQPNNAPTSAPVQEDQSNRPASGVAYVYPENVLGKKANDSAVNHLYQQYFGRDATQAELNNWGNRGGSDTTVGALEDFLRSEQIKYGIKPGSGEEPPTPNVSSSVLPDSVDTEGLSGEDVATLEEMYTQAQNDPRLIALQSITEEDVAGFLDTAKAEFRPYFEQKIRRAKEDFVRGLQFKAEDREAEIKRERLQAQIDLENKQDELADRGYAFSGTRKLAEERLATEAADIAESSRRVFQYNVDTLGRAAEDLLGSENIANVDIPEIGGEDIFQASGDVKGSLEREQTTAELDRANELERDARVRRVSAVDADAALNLL